MDSEKIAGMCVLGLQNKSINLLLVTFPQTLCWMLAAQFAVRGWLCMRATRLQLTSAQLPSINTEEPDSSLTKLLPLARMELRSVAHRFGYCIRILVTILTDYSFYF